MVGDFGWPFQDERDSFLAGGILTSHSQHLFAEQHFRRHRFGWLDSRELQVALDLLCKAEAETWLVLGDMGELGEEGKQLHRKVGESARQARVQRLFALGELAAEAAEAFGDDAETFAGMDALNARLKELVHAGVIVLVKGSRAMRMECVREALSTDEGDA